MNEVDVQKRYYAETAYAYNAMHLHEKEGPANVFIS